MLKNYFKIALRNIKKYKAYSFINILGLAIVMASFILIALFVYDELSYDKYHSKADRIYRITWKENTSVSRGSALTSLMVAPHMANTIPEGKHFFRLSNRSDITVNYKDIKQIEDNFFLADPSIIDILDFKFIKGNPKLALTAPNSIVITETTAKRYFKDEEPLGKTLIIEKNESFHVTGIIADMPKQSHFHADFFGSLTTYGEMTNPWQHWGWTYVMLPENVSPAILEQKFELISNPDNSVIYIEGMKYSLQPLTKIHLYSNFTGEIEANSDIRYTYIFSFIAILLLLIACANYMNITTARSTKRIKEIGIRKVVGSLRKQLVMQFLGESIIISLLGVILALILVELTLPVFSSLIQKELEIHYLQDYWIIPFCFIIALFVGIISGSYPGIFLSKYQPMKIIKGISDSGKTKITFRKILVVLQFTITIGLISSAIIIQSQLNYIQNKKLGFDKENIIVLSINDNETRTKYESLKAELLQHPAIKKVTAANGTPLSGGIFSSLKKTRYQIKLVDPDYISTFGMEIIKGRDFSKEIITDKDAFIMNETAIKMHKWENPIGKQYEGGFARKTQGQVIGVLKDFHNNSLHLPIEPLILQISPKKYSTIMIKIQMSDLEETISFLEKKWNEFIPHRPFSFSFLDEAYDKQYRSEQRLSEFFNYFSFLTIFIASLGLFGLAAFAAEQRTKEIGIRKVLGASIGNILFILLEDFTKWVLIANITAWPIAFYFMSSWLQQFAYRINIEYWFFLIAGALAFTIAVLTVSIQAIKVAVANPVESLRYE